MDLEQFLVVNTETPAFLSLSSLSLGEVRLFSLYLGSSGAVDRQLGGLVVHKMEPDVIL